MQRFVLTGGHGVGKTSILLALEQLGEYVVPEAAGDVRKLEQARGRPFPEDASDFESNALALHLQREDRVPDSVTRVFFDRAAPDHLAYSRVGRWPLTSEEMAVCAVRRYNIAFLVESPSEEVPTLDRGEREFCRRLVPAIDRAYRSMGIPVMRVTYRDMSDRVQFILDSVADYSRYHDNITDGAAPWPAERPRTTSQRRT